MHAVTGAVSDFISDVIDLMVALPVSFVTGGLRSPFISWFARAGAALTGGLAGVAWL